MVSGFHRISGCVMAGTLLFGGVGFALLPFNFTQFVEYIRSWNLHPVITSVFKFIIAYPIAFHTLNGIRFIGFDMAKGVDNIGQIYKGGYLVLALAAIIAAYAVFNAWPTNKEAQRTA
ncbi:succinate dehydrogenase cytochrome b subunit [Oesophagostomum dentatum]|uniref:Succinate dehydrogenase cytochrome b subunit n=1 Tax=Oesophagostomum dentatum TaxID=61180 RepID=A0A0B1SPD3_OESDE|nr:succinate dehydrogenase cytochrome b subunit [Oesophagostomum dentatum]